MKTSLQIIAAASLLVLSGLANAGPAAPIPTAITAAVSDPARPPTDRERDARRLPAETIAFAGVKPGDVVGELLPGGGYYTRILSKVVGPQGHVYAFAPPPPVNAPADMADFSARVRAIAADPAYANVSVVLQQLGNISFPAPVDLVWTSQNYHDFHNIDGVDVGMLNKQIFDALKPGGVYLVLDHAAAAGAGSSVTKTLHRIDVETVKQEVLAAGFVLEGSSKLLERSTDPHTAAVFDPSVRGMTDQFILKFRKPKAKGK
ncbi:MAG: class I SAM-dependent methyltransferase [Steroidobacterales bacterium]